MVTADPAYLRAFQSPWTKNRLRFFLILQGILLNPSEIHSFEHANYSGFQFGSPETDEHCELIFFDDAGDAFQVMFYGGKDGNQTVNQQVMNGVIRSFRKEAVEDASP